MISHVDPALLLAEAKIVPPPVQRGCEDHGFEIPGGAYLAMALLLLGFLVVLAIGLPTPGLVVPMAINLIFLAAFFAIPALFVRAGGSWGRSTQWNRFLSHGIDTATGHTSGREALALLLMLPAFIFCWSVAIVIIAAFA